MLETPGASPAISASLQELLEIKPKRYSHDGTDTDMALLIEAGLLSGEEPPPLHVSDFYGIGGHTHRRTTEEGELQVLIKRVATAVFGGAIVVAPMLIITLHPSQLVALLTTSAFVLIIALVLAIAMKDAAPKDILTAIAAYAAVLVVFVGTSSSSA